MQTYMRRAAAAGRDTERIGPFLATFSGQSTNPFLNYAIPDDGARPTAAEVDALTDAYRARELLPRLEFLADTAPRAEAALLAAGYVLERRVPLMLCPPGTAVEIAAPAGIELLVPESDEDIVGMLGAQYEAFGQSQAITESDIASSRNGLAGGGFAVYARDSAGASAGGGVAEAVSDGTSEVAGIGVRVAYRRRGIAAAMTSALTLAVHAAGAHTVFLTPAGDAEQRIYARVGFRAADDMVHLSLPD